MSVWATVCAVACGLVVVLCVRERYRKNPSRPSLPFPPGPLGLPWVGNVLRINASAPWLTYREWAKSYGDLMYSQLLGKDVIIISSEKVAKDLLEERSKIYSGRPSLITAELCGLGFNSGTLPYGDKWRLHRRFFHQTFRLDGSRRLLPIQHRRSCELLRRLLHTPEQFSDHVFEYTATVVLKSVYDYDAQHENDRMIDIAAKVLHIIVPLFSSEVAILVAAVPALLKLPSWLPGMSFKKRMGFARGLSKEYLETPFAYALQRLPSPQPIPSMVHDALRHVDENGIPREQSWMQNLKEATATSFLGASETSNSVILAALLLMAMNPEKQRNAQAEIDAVVGNERLPTINDRPSLPYVDAIFRETLRYNPPFPMSVPHATVDDDVYNGFHIPKGAMVMVNLWSMMHDESRYPDPYAFRPERFLNDDGSLKPNGYEDVVYGFGRRNCVGKHFADTSVWTVIAKVLAVFTVLNPVDENGAEIVGAPKFTTGPITQPRPFRCKFIPRVDGMDEKKLEELIIASGD